MFTGLIEAVGTVQSCRSASGGMRLTVRVPFAAELTTGESIAVDGACLTVVKRGRDVFEADVSGETLAHTTLGALGAGSQVNLERAMKLGDRLGGHMVSGHVDGTGRIVRRRRDGAYEQVQIKPGSDLAGAILLKGSIAVDGISLTVSAVERGSFGVTLIPETIAATTLARKRDGEAVNLETDMIGKYVEQHLARTGTAPGGTGRGAAEALFGAKVKEGG